MSNDSRALHPATKQNLHYCYLQRDHPKKAMIEIQHREVTRGLKLVC